MESRSVGLIQDQNLNVQFNGKANVTKAQRKAGIGGRKPLGDLSNSVKPTPNQTSKKESVKIIPFILKEIQKAKLGILEEDRSQLEDIAEEGCLHNHQDCIKAQKIAISTNEFLRILGLDDFSKHSTFAKEYSLSNKMEATSPPRYAESNKMTAMMIEELSPPKHMLSRKLDSFEASPEPLDHHMQWDGPKYTPSFKLIESP
ncbi:hypothetical protein HRI_004548000 [Hibiscus trionum]|uniref:Uncharacterized protein n=1 Tax=Hibiscus trionum TaxID=183268 RepID=A0A9W7J9H8_HIBTR|nr:hypothetical protein HRI_004548000 [Hibiscus trionum]